MDEPKQQITLLDHHCTSLFSFYKLLPWIDIDKLNWDMLSSNPNAIHLLEQNPDKINWVALSRNPNAIHLLEQNPNKIYLYNLSQNPNTIHLLEQNQDKINWLLLSLIFIIEDIN